MEKNRTTKSGVLRVPSRRLGPPPLADGIGDAISNITIFTPFKSSPCGMLYLLYYLENKAEFVSFTNIRTDTKMYKLKSNHMTSISVFN